MTNPSPVEIAPSSRDKKSPTVPEEAVRSRYSQGAQQKAAELCCPVSFDRRLLEIIPEEVIERDYGCGDPTPFVKPGETVLDLGSGGGKVCFITAQIVGPEGKVIGVDCNQEMLTLARRHQPVVAQRLGFDNVEFRCGLIQDLQLNLDLLAQELQNHPVSDPQSWLDLRFREQRLRQEKPLVADESVDCVVSNCVLNLVRQEDREQLFAEIFRVLRKNGRAAISDIVSDEDVPEHMQNDPHLWSGCLSGAFREDQFLQAFEKAGFHGIQIVKREKDPWRVVEGIEFRSVTVLAYKGKQGPCLERKQGLIYRGPFKKVEDDDGHVFPRGQRIAVCDKTFHLLQQDPYKDCFEAIEPQFEIPLESATDFLCQRTPLRHPRETKGEEYQITTGPAEDCCGTDGDCC